MKEHIIFFDSTCPMCQKSVRKIQSMDTKGVFEFFPLNSEMAREHLSEELLSADTLVLFENKKEVWIRASAIFRILYLIGGKYKKWGWLAHVPGLDLFYRIIATNRHFF